MPNVMAALPNIGGTLCESSVIRFLVPCRKLWLMLTAQVPCSNAINMGEHKTWRRSEFCSWQNCIRRQELQKCIYSVPAHEMAKHCEKFGWPPLSDVGAVTKPRRETRLNLLGCPKLPNRSQPLVGQSSYCEDLWRRYCCLTSFFPIVDSCLSCEDIARQKLWDGAQMAIFGDFFASRICSEPRAAHFTYIRQGGHHVGHWPTFLVMVALCNGTDHNIYGRPM